MTDMRRPPAEKAEVASAWNGPDYPYGLTISLSEVELEKLGMSEDVEVGDMLHLHAMAKVTSVAKHDNEASGASCRVELQITHMVGESEDDENDDATPAARRRNKLYG